MISVPVQSRPLLRSHVVFADLAGKISTVPYVQKNEINDRPVASFRLSSQLNPSVPPVVVVKPV